MHSTWVRIERTYYRDHLHVDVQWHQFVDRWRQFQYRSLELSEGQGSRKKISEISKTADIKSSETPAHWIGDSWKRKLGNVRSTSVVILRMQRFCCARSIQPISPVSTVQSRIGVMKCLSRFLVNHFQAWRNPLRRWLSSEIKKLEPEGVNTLVQALGTNVRAAGDTLRDHQKKFENVSKEIKKCLRFVNQLDSWRKSLSDNTGCFSELDIFRYLTEVFCARRTRDSRFPGHSAPRTHRGEERFPGMTLAYALIQDKAKIKTKARVTELTIAPH